MRKFIDKLEFYFMLADKFAAGGKKKNNKNVKVKKKLSKVFFDDLISYGMMVNEMGAGGKRK